MRKLLHLCASLTVLFSVHAAHASDNQSFERWHDNKFSMFIHFGLYSHLGGVWDGEPVRQGYSEQIQSFAGIFGDWYASVAQEFDPVHFDAEAVTALAKEAGMRSIVFTSKHHDGFCMFDTATTDYDSVEATPSGRDYVRELSQACAKEGLGFGLYFSLIDWHYPHAYPISSHNADFITPEHHELNKRQVRELLTSYGPVSELWFDMGSLTPLQSRELYDLVKQLQPDCMVSGRLGNDMYDFAVMADNKLPDSQLHAPWQSAASMFPETWSWRSWQERGEVADKVKQKLGSLVEVVSRGGNYLLNIGPRADGSVVPFEAEVLRGMGAWLADNGDAVYGTSPSPFRQAFDWGCVTVKDNRMYLILNGDYPACGEIVLHMPGYRLRSCVTEGVLCRSKEDYVRVAVTEDLYSMSGYPHVVCLAFDKDIKPFNALSSVGLKETLACHNASADYSYSCFDYYSNYRSTVGYNWAVAGKGKVSEVEITYTADEIGRNVIIDLGTCSLPVCLDGGKPVDCFSSAAVGEMEVARIRGGVFDGPASWEKFDWDGFSGIVPQGESFPARPFSNYLLTSVVDMPQEGELVLNVTSGNGVEVIVNRVPVMKHLNKYRSLCNEEKLLLHLPEGRSEIAVRSYNRFEKTSSVMLSVDADASVYRKTVRLATPLSADGLKVRLSAADCESPHKDCLLHNLRIVLR